MRTLVYIALLIVAWWVGASGLFTMSDATDAINSARDRIEDTQ